MLTNKSLQIFYWPNQKNNNPCPGCQTMGFVSPCTTGPFVWCLINLHVLISIEIMSKYSPCPMTGSGNVTMSDRVTLQHTDRHIFIHVIGLQCTCTSTCVSTTAQIHKYWQPLYMSFGASIYIYHKVLVLVARLYSQEINMHFQSSLAGRGQSLLLILLHSKCTQMYL